MVHVVSSATGGLFCIDQFQILLALLSPDSKNTSDIS